MKIAVAVLMLLVLSGCSASKPPTPPANLEARAQGAGYLACSLMPAANRQSAIAVLSRLQGLASVDINQFIAQLEAVPTGDTGALGMVWYAIHSVLGVVGWAANYQPVAVAAVNGCLAALRS